MRLPKNAIHVPWLWAACMFSQPCMSLARAPAILHGNRYHVFFLIFKAESRSELKMCWFVYLIFLWPYPSRKWVESMFNLVFSMCYSHPPHSWIASESWIASILLSLRNHHLLKFIAASVARFGSWFKRRSLIRIIFMIVPDKSIRWKKIFAKNTMNTHIGTYLGKCRMDNFSFSFWMKNGFEFLVLLQNNVKNYSLKNSIINDKTKKSYSIVSSIDNSIDNINDSINDSFSQSLRFFMFLDAILSILVRMSCKLSTMSSNKPWGLGVSVVEVTVV